MMTSDDDFERVLSDAAERLRGAAPTERASRAAFDNRSMRTGSSPGRRSWWPVGIGIALVAAATIGIFTLQVADRGEDGGAELPADIPTVEPTPAPTIKPDETVPGSIDPAPLPSTTIVGAIIVGPGIDPDVEFDGPFAVDGLDGVQALEASPSEGVTCVLFVGGGDVSRKELCLRGDDGPVSAFTVLDGQLVHLEFAKGEPPTAVVLDERIWPSSGCTLDDARAMVDAALGNSFGSELPMLVFTGLRCAGNRGSLSAGSVLLQTGPPDGTTVFLLETNGEWTVVASGTGVDELQSHPVPRFDVWSTWPGDTDPMANEFDLSEAGSAANPDELSQRVIALLTQMLSSDPEFPPDVRAGSTELPLLVVEALVNGDDSIAGYVFYVWLSESLDANGATVWDVGTSYMTRVCPRGSDGQLCV